MRLGGIARAVAVAAVLAARAAGGETLQEGFSGGLLIEAGSEEESADPSWWLSSGAYFDASSGAGTTVLGSLPDDDPWRQLYAASNPLDTDDGHLPQNLFRLAHRARWEEGVQEVFFRIHATNLTDSPNRAGHNGILFFSRYRDSGTLYYAGLRVDGRAVVKRKKAGAYTTLGSALVYAGSYDRWQAPNLIPVGRWIGMRSTTASQPDGSVRIRLEILDPERDPDWTLLLEVADPIAIEGEGRGGLRSDFVDVEFDGYRLSGLEDPPSPSAPTPTATATPVFWPTPSPTIAQTPVPTPTTSAVPTPSPAATAAPAPHPTSTIAPTPTPKPLPTSTPIPAPPPDCSFDLDPDGAAFDATGGEGTMSWTTDGGCDWTAYASVPWIGVHAPSGRGSAVVSYSVSPNPDPRGRRGLIVVDERTLRVRQAGAGGGRWGDGKTTGSPGSR